MADSKLTDLLTKTTLDGAEELYINDTSTTPNTDKKTTIGQMLRAGSHPFIYLPDEGIYPDTGVDLTQQLITLQQKYNGEGRTLFAPAGEYRVSDLPILGNTTLQGDGWGTIFKPASNTQNGVFIHQNPRGVVRSLTIDGDRQNFTSNGVKFINQHAWSVSYESVNFIYLTGNSVVTTQNNDLLFHRCVFQGGDAGFLNLVEAYAAKVSKCVFQYGGVQAGLPYAINITANAASLNTVEDCWFEFDGSVTGIGGAGGDNNIVECIIADGVNIDIQRNRFNINNVPTNTSLVRFGPNALYCKSSMNNYFSKGANAVNITWDAGATRNISTLDRSLRSPTQFTDNGTATTIFTGDATRYPEYTVNTVPPASFYDGYGTVIFVADGDSGAPCLAVAINGNWKRIPIGNNISAT